MPKLAPAALVARSALFTYLAGGRLAQDAKLDYDSFVKGVTSKNYRSKKDAIAKSVIAATKGKLAQDADIMDLANLLDALSPSAEKADGAVMPMQTEPNSAAPPMANTEEDGDPEDIVAKIKAYLQQEGVPPEILQNLDAFLAEEGNPKPDVGDPNNPPEAPPEAPPKAEGPPNGAAPSKAEAKAPPKNGDQGMPSTLPPPTAVGGVDENQLEDCVGDETEEEEEERKRKEAEDEVIPSEQSDPITKTAMDEAIKTAVSRAIQTQKAVQEAHRFVRPWVGDIAMDAAHPSQVHRAALKALGMDAKEVDKLHPQALLQILKYTPKPNARKPNQPSRMAADAKSGGGFLERFPDAGKIVLQ